MTRTGSNILASFRKRFSLPWRNKSAFVLKTRHLFQRYCHVLKNMKSEDKEPKLRSVLDAELFDPIPFCLLEWPENLEFLFQHDIFDSFEKTLNQNNVTLSQEEKTDAISVLPGDEILALYFPGPFYWRCYLLDSSRPCRIGDRNCVGEARVRRSSEKQPWKLLETRLLFNNRLLANLPQADFAFFFVHSVFLIVQNKVTNFSVLTLRRLKILLSLSVQTEPSWGNLKTPEWTNTASSSWKLKDRSICWIPSPRAPFASSSTETARIRRFSLKTSIVTCIVVHFGPQSRFSSQTVESRNLWTPLIAQSKLLWSVSWNTPVLSLGSSSSHFLDATFSIQQKFAQTCVARQLKQPRKVQVWHWSLLRTQLSLSESKVLLRAS